MRLKKEIIFKGISPTGRQCSDFVAFDTRKLEKGIEKGLDWQTTRTFMGNTFPGPGLFSKFYEQIMSHLLK
ncbi:MAG: hypothetical protein CM1200mP13_04340 [Candidatus Pelagibacterales bacterium]|nr:MAG: hypothetical protein CM1200mP13_04340 [Pelagibacterales bacterium]